MRPYVLVAAGAAPRCVAQIRKCWRRLVSTKKGHPYILQLLPGECRAGGKVRAGSQVDVPPCAGRLLQDWHLEVCAVAYIVFVRKLRRRDRRKFADFQSLSNWHSFFTYIHITNIMLRCLAIAVAGILAASGSLAVVASYAIGTHLGAHGNASKRTMSEHSSCLFPPRFFFPSSSSSLIVEVCGHYSYARIDPGGGLSFSEITFAAPAHLQSPPGHCNDCNTLITEVSFGALIFLSGIFSMLISKEGMRIIPKYILKK